MTSCQGMNVINAVLIFLNKSVQMHHYLNVSIKKLSFLNENTFHSSLVSLVKKKEHFSSAESQKKSSFPLLKEAIFSLSC